MHFMNPIIRLELARQDRDDQIQAAAQHRRARAVAAEVRRDAPRAREARLQVRPEESRA